MEDSMTESGKDLTNIKTDSNNTAAVDEPLGVSGRLLWFLLIWGKFTPVERLTLLMAATLLIMGIVLVLLMV
jgi:hypothetical protein